jgi:CHAT domain-containing protein
VWRLPRPAAIVSLLPPRRVFKAVDFKATRETVLNAALDRYRIVHFATHGLLDAQRPALSGLVLSLVDERGAPRNGYLRLPDIYNMRLDADLVVLSACETALGKEVKGEGLVGLARAFMYAGAPRVVASLWQVSDVATAELMKRFYRGMLQQHLRPAAALHAAQVNMQTDPRWRAPYFWAGFTLIGDWR